MPPFQDVCSTAGPCPNRTVKAGSMSGSNAAYSSRWLGMLASGEVKSLREIAEREKIDNS